MNKNKQIRNYSTQDIALAAYLNIHSPLLEIEVTHRKGNFVFQDSDFLAKRVKEYWLKQAQVEPLEYFNSLKSLKTRLYNNGF